MNPNEQYGLLKRNVSEWNAWRATHTILVDLRAANLGQVDLRGANLDSVDLRGANLASASLREASLVDANLASADLTGADLTDADLRGANLHGALLRRTNLQNAVLGKTLLIDLDLRSAGGLESCKHEGPSSIDFSTLTKSPGIPQRFFLACGVPQQVIEYLHAHREGPIEHYSCFLSYASRDEAFARQLHSDLQNLGVMVWFAPHDLRVGDRLRDQIDSAIRVYDKIILVLSSESTKSKWVQYEVKKALSVERDTSRTVLFPVSLDDSLFRSSGDWARTLRERYILDFSRWREGKPYEAQLSRLAKALTLTLAHEMPGGA